MSGTTGHQYLFTTNNGRCTIATYTQNVAQTHAAGLRSACRSPAIARLSGTREKTIRRVNFMKNLRTSRRSTTETKDSLKPVITSKLVTNNNGNVVAREAMYRDGLDKIFFTA